MSKKMRMISAALAGTLLLSMLTGCSSDNTATPSATQTSVPTAMPTVVPEDAAAISANVDQDVVVTAPEVTEGLDATQRNSISMLNHLAVLTQEINASQNSRMYLEEAYSMLINNTFPNAVDSSLHQSVREHADGYALSARHCCISYSSKPLRSSS